MLRIIAGDGKEKALGSSSGRFQHTLLRNPPSLYSLSISLNSPSLFLLSGGSEAQWLARRTRDPAVAGSIPSTAHVVIALGKQFTCISSVHPSAKLVPGYRQLKCID